MNTSERATTWAGSCSTSLPSRHGGTYRGKFSGRLAEVRVGDRRLALLKPETYMNESGRSVGAAMRFFKSPVESLVVVHDDVDLEEGRLQVRGGGGLAGHNGLRSLADALGSRDFLRVRIGVGRPGRGDPRPVSDYVLSPFPVDADVGAGHAAADAVEAHRARGARGCAAPIQLTQNRHRVATHRSERSRSSINSGAEDGGPGICPKGTVVGRRAPSAAPAPLYTDPRGMRIPSFVMDQPPLLALADVLADSDELGELANRLPSVRARVSEPALPLVLAALHRRLRRRLICLLPDDEDARDAAEAASWFLDGDSVAFMPGRGVAADSGLRPPPHLVGERLRALSVLDDGGLVCISAAAAAEGLPPESERAVPVEIAVGQASGLEELAEALVLAGYERVERVEERGQIAVRGGILDVFGTTGREPIRVELFGDVVEGVRAFSPFTQRALRELERAVVFPASERQADLAQERHRLGRDRRARAAGRPRVEARRGARGLA